MPKTATFIAHKNELLSEMSLAIQACTICMIGNRTVHAYAHVLGQNVT